MSSPVSERVAQITKPSAFAVCERICNWLSRPASDLVVSTPGDLDASLGTAIGPVRVENQDRALIARFTSDVSRDHSFLLLALCDGVGGLEHGAQSAELALGFLISSLIQNRSPASTSRLSSAVLAANKEVFRTFKGNGATTLTALLVSGQGDRAAVSIGDTRLYRFSRDSGLVQVSRDDTIAAELQRIKGDQRPSRNLDARFNQLAQYVGMGEGADPRQYSLPRPTDDTLFVLSSDGAHNIEQNTLERLIRTAPSPNDVVTRLIQVSMWCGGEDNATVICYRPRTKGKANPLMTEPALLEVWDCAGKIELFVSTAPPEKTPGVPPSPGFSEPQKPLADHQDTPPKKTDKRPKKKKPGNRRTKKQTSDIQRKLEIEVADDDHEKDRNAPPGDVADPSKRE